MAWAFVVLCLLISAAGWVASAVPSALESGLAGFGGPGLATAPGRILLAVAALEFLIVAFWLIPRRERAPWSADALMLILALLAAGIMGALIVGSRSQWAARDASHQAGFGALAAIGAMQTLITLGMGIYLQLRGGRTPGLFVPAILSTLIVSLFFAFVLFA